jgi:D-sedoheptulose 7-phosphate isomerase
MFSDLYLGEVAMIATQINSEKIENIVQALNEVRARGGRVFVLGLGGSAANASHMVNDLRKLCHIEAYAPTDNVSELTARVNDSKNGWDLMFSYWLQDSNLDANDLVFILSVGGGSLYSEVSLPLVYALKTAAMRGARVTAIVGRDDGYVVTDVPDQSTVLVVPAMSVQPKRVTPHSEEFQAVIWHCLVSHPALQTEQTKW